MKNGNFKFQGVSIVSASLRKALAGNAKKKKMECLHSDGSASYLKQNFGC